MTKQEFETKVLSGDPKVRETGITSELAEQYKDELRKLEFYARIIDLQNKML